MKNKLNAHGEATVRLINKNTGKVGHEVTAKNALNLDFAAAIKASIYTPTTNLTVFLSDYDQPAPANGLIFPMGKFLGNGKYNTTASGQHQGAWFAEESKLSIQQNGKTSSTFVWDFASAQAVGTLRSLFLYWNTNTTWAPAVAVPTGISWKGTPRWFVENQLLDGVAKTATQYTVGDYYTKDSVLLNKSNTLTLSGIARDVDNGHIFIFDAADKKLYEFASLDVDMISANILAEYPCTKAFVGKGLIKGGNLFYLSGNANPTDPAAANPAGAELYLFRYAYKTDSVPVQIDTITCAEAGFTSFQSNDACAFLDDYVILHGITSPAGISPVLRVFGSTAKAGFCSFSSSSGSTNYVTIQRVSPNRQILLEAVSTTATAAPNSNAISRTPPMAISHLLLPTPIVKDNQHRLTVSYTISIQD